MSTKRFVESLASFVPRVVAERLAVHPDPPAEPLIVRAHAAVLFADISGFTRLAEALSQRGPGGVEELTGTLNADLGSLVNVIYEHGGDVIKFAGDALLALWRCDPDQLQDAVLRAAACGLEAQKRFGDLPEMAGVRISVRIAVGAGPLNLAMVGGVDGRWELLAAGEALEQIGGATHAGQPGEVVLSPTAWALVEGVATGEDSGAGVVRLISVEAAPVPNVPFLELPVACAEALRCFVPPTVLAFLEGGRGDWIGELRRVSVIFALFPGLTSRTPLDRAQAAMRVLQTVVYRYEGTINKLSVDDKGTALVAALGLPPLAHEDDAARAAAAGLDILERMGQAGIRTSIGIASGRVFCGVVGSAQRREYTMIGDVVNLAARLMQSAADEVVCDEATQSAARSRVLFEPMPEISVKGKTVLIRPFRAVAGRPEGTTAAAAEAPMVGREAERALLDARLEELVGAGIGGALLIEGGPGIGKSRLLAYLAEQAEARKVPFLKGSTSPVDRGTPYFVWREVMALLLGTSDAVSAAERRGRVLERVRLSLPHQEPRLALGNPVLLTDFEETEATAGLPEEVRAAATRDLLASLIAPVDAADMPRVLVLEDAHWMDSASWALAAEIVRCGYPLLLVLAARPLGEGVATEARLLLELPASSRIRLDALTAEDSIRIVCRRLGVEALPTAVAAVIREKAEGNPLFSEELAYALRDAGQIVVDGRTCRLAEGAGLRPMDLPPTVQAAMTARIDRLPATHQVALKTASVIGRQFASRVLGDLCPTAVGDESVEAMLHELARRDLTLPAPASSELAYLFKHALLQDVAYNLMLFAQRRQLHRAMAEWIEAHPDSLAFQNPVLAHHWGKVVEYGGAEPALVEKAADYFHKSAEEGLRSYANREAISFLREELRLLGTLPPGVERDRKELALHCALGPPLIATLGFAAPEVEQTYLRARELCREREVSLERFHLIRGLWNYYVVKGRIRQARELSQELFESSLSLGDIGAQLAANRALAENAVWVGEFSLAAQLLDESLDILSRQNTGPTVVGADTDAGVVCLGFSAWVLWLQGFPERSMERILEALALARKTGHPHSIALTYQNLTMLCQFRDEPEPAQKWAEALRELSSNEGFQMWAAAAAIMRGWAVARLGQPDEGIAEIRQGLAAWRSTGAVLVVPYYLSMLAGLLSQRGEATEALKLLEEAQAACEESGESWWLAEILRERGAVLRMLNFPEEAEKFFRKAIALAKEQQAQSLERRAGASLTALLA